MSAPVHPVDVFLVLTRGEEVLLGRRQGTGYADGTWNLPSGKLETHEDAVTGVIREAKEEIGVLLDPADVRLATVVHHRNAEGGARVGLFFTAVHEPDRHGEVVNTEPHKCAQLDWFPLGALPEPTYRYTAAGLQAVQDRAPLRLDGWR